MGSASKGKAHRKLKPAIWTVAALASALGRPGLLTGEAREQALGRLAYAQQALKTYRPIEGGGWNMFPNQEEPALNNIYTSTLASLALLETHRANLPWEGSIEKRDQSLKSTAQWIADQYEDQVDPPGWHAASEMHAEPIDGLTLQIYGELLRAESEAGFVVPQTILNQIPDYLAKTVERPLDFPSDSGEFAGVLYRSSRTTVRRPRGARLSLVSLGDEYRSALAASRREARAYMEDQVRVRRSLGHLVNDLGPLAVQKYRTEWTFQAAETLYGLSAIPEK